MILEGMAAGLVLAVSRRSATPESSRPATHSAGHAKEPLYLGEELMCPTCRLCCCWAECKPVAPAQAVSVSLCISFPDSLKPELEL